MARKVSIYTVSLNNSLVSGVANYVISKSRKDILSEEELRDMVYDFFELSSKGSLIAVDIFRRAMGRERRLGYHDGIVFDSVDSFIYWLEESTDFFNDLINELEHEIRISEDKVNNVGRKETYFEIELDDFEKWRQSLLSSMRRHHRDLTGYHFYDFF